MSHILPRRARHFLIPPIKKGIDSPRLGYFGVIDERMDVELIRRIADARPSWQIVMVGPIVKIDPTTLPTRPNIHYLGQKSYEELPRYLSGWDDALMPFAENDSTRFISPTKTLEYLAGGRPIVSTPIADVVDQYGALGLVEIARAENFVSAIEGALPSGSHPRAAEVDAFLAKTSWQRTWSQMTALVDAEIERKLFSYSNVGQSRGALPKGDAAGV
jgi:UDP-galactopyranose mutase